MLHLPHELAQPGKMGDILKSLLLKRGHYAVLVSKMEDTLAEQPLVTRSTRMCMCVYLYKIAHNRASNLALSYQSF